MNENTNNNAKSNATGGKLLSFMTAVMCIVILVVSFIAFRNIENTAHASIVLLSGVMLDGIIFFNGTEKKHKQ